VWKDFNVQGITGTGISEELRVKSEEGLARQPEGESQSATATEWYTLDGRRLSGKPAQRGIDYGGGFFKYQSCCNVVMVTNSS